MKKTTAALVAAFLCAAAPAAYAQQASEDWQTIDMLTEMVANSIGRSANPIDRRIVLARCPEQVSVKPIDGQSLAVRCASLGWRLRVPMAAAATASHANYARPAAPVIRRGDNVRVTIETESFSVNYLAVAVQDGRVGESITLRSNDSTNNFIATVTGPGRAHITD